MPIFAVRSVGKKEKNLMEVIEHNAKAKKVPIKSILFIPEIKGYVFVEAENFDDVKAVSSNVPMMRGILEKPVKREELEKFFQTTTALQKFEIGDIVEIVGGPFKREKAKIISIDETKQEAKIELIDISMPIPITIKLDLLRRIKE